jgi:hypothetical protein
MNLLPDLLHCVEREIVNPLPDPLHCVEREI